MRPITSYRSNEPLSVTQATNDNNNDNKANEDCLPGSATNLNTKKAKSNKSTILSRQKFYKP